MITFVRTPGCSQCQEVCEALRHLAVSHRVVPVDHYSGHALDLPPDTTPPLLIDEGQVCQGHDEIRRWLADPDDFTASRTKSPADACRCKDAALIH